MMGRLNGDQGRLFYAFCLNEVVPDDHLVRAIADVLDLSWVRAELAAAVLLEMPASRRTHGRSGPNQRPRSVAGAVPAAMPDRGQRPER